MDKLLWHLRTDTIQAISKLMWKVNIIIREEYSNIQSQKHKSQ